VITFEELAVKFPVQNVAPYGAVVVVPGVEFDPDWEVFLGDRGYRCRFIDLDQRPVVLVQRKNPSGQGEREVYVPHEREDFGFKMKHSNEVVQFAQELASQTDPAYSLRDIAGEIEKKFGVKVSHVAIGKWIGKSGGESMENKENRKKFHGWQRGPSWSPEEEQRLLKRIEELTGPIKMRARQLAPEFDRSAIALVQKHKKLIKCEKQGSKPKVAEKSLQSSDEVAEKSDPQRVTDSNSIRPAEERISRLEDITDTLQKIVEDLQKALDDRMAELENDIAAGDLKTYLKIRKELASHKHAVSGEAMLPMEA
jgi:hypothetical protein